MKALFRTIDALNRDYAGNLVIGGSLALKLHGIDLGRYPKDLDVILTSYYDHDAKVPEDIIQEPYGGLDRSATIDRDGMRIDVFFDPDVQYTYMNLYNKEYRVADVLYILKFKLKYALQGWEISRKQMDDLINIYYKYKIEGNNVTELI